MKYYIEVTKDGVPVHDLPFPPFVAHHTAEEIVKQAIAETVENWFHADEMENIFSTFLGLWQIGERTAVINGAYQLMDEYRMFAAMQEYRNPNDNWSDGIQRFDNLVKTFCVVNGIPFPLWKIKPDEPQLSAQPQNIVTQQPDAAEAQQSPSPDVAQTVTDNTKTIKDCMLVDDDKKQQTSDAAEGATTNTASTDFQHTTSYKPVISFDMSALYSFLIDEGVICGIDEQLFSDCISHANVNELWENCVKSKFKLVIHHIKLHYTPEWFGKLCDNIGMTQQEMGKFNVPTRKEFETKMRMLN